VLGGGYVTRHGHRDRKGRKTTVRPMIPPSRLDAMIEEAIVDAYNEAEQAVGFHATIEQRLALPFETVVLGTIVTVRKIDVTASGNIVAVCYRGRERQAIPILELSLPHPLPVGWEWIEAYRRWARGRW
jgi:hypothetical protein